MCSTCGKFGKIANASNKVYVHERDPLQNCQPNRTMLLLYFLQVSPKDQGESQVSVGGMNARTSLVLFRPFLEGFSNEGV